MKFAVADLTPIPTDFEFSLEPSWVAEALGESETVRAFAPCEVRLAAQAIGETLVFRGTARCPVHMDCSRCLREVEVDLGEPLDLVLEPRSKGSAVGEAEDAQELGFGFYDGPEVDLDPLLREILALNVPMRVVCDEACRGLCPRCGRNLNDGACDCPQD